MMNRTSDPRFLMLFLPYLRLWACGLKFELHDPNYIFRFVSEDWLNSSSYLRLIRSEVKCGKFSLAKALYLFKLYKHLWPLHCRYIIDYRIL